MLKNSIILLLTFLCKSLKLLTGDDYMAEIIKYSTEKKSTEYVVLNSCGEQLLFGDDFNMLRKNGRIDFLVHYITEGEETYTLNDKKHTVSAGNFIIYYPSAPQNYSFKSNIKTGIMWAHFTGSVCDILLPFKGNGVISAAPHDRDFERLFKKMISAHYLKKPYNEKICEGYLLTLISMMTQSVSDVPVSIPSATHDGLERVLNHMNIYYNSEIDIKKYADMCFVSRDRFIHLFKEHTGTSPYRYQLQIRIERAKELLSNTPISVSRCAEEVGFKDASYFCRVFK